MKRLTLGIRTLVAAQSGTVLPLFGLSIFAVLGATGIAIDYGRASMMQSKLHAAIDAAGLAAGAVSYSRDVNTEVLKFAEANFPQDYMGTKYTVTGPGGAPIVVDANGNIDIEAKGTVSTTFMNIFGIREVNIAANTQVARGNKTGLEVVMALDNSGSMSGTQGGISRRNAMVNGANEFLNIVYDPESNLEPVYIGLVPFNSYVKPGAARKPGSSWLRANSGTSTANANAVNCLNDEEEERTETYAVGDQPPATGSPNTLWNQNELSTTCALADMVPMRGTKAQVSTSLNTMGTNGNTRVDLGAVWAWRMISPRWAGLWNHVGSLPQAYNTPLMQKVVILLTDGENNPNPGTVTFAQSNTRQIQACTAMKANGIIVYGITFHTTNATAISTMKACATSPDHYFHAAGNSSIATVFQQIAESLVNLRLSR